MALSEKLLVERQLGFSFPTTAPVSLDDAWRFMEQNPFPPDRFVARPLGATREELASAERALGRALPAVLRDALTRHNGIEETWTRSGPFLAGAHELAEEWRRFRRHWDELQKLTAEGDIAAEDWEGLGPADVRLESLFALGHDQSGRVFFVLDAGRADSAGEHPVLWFDPETPFVRARWRSLGNFVAWMVCDAHCHPQRQPPPQMDQLFPRY